jgi:hypothetical protein
VKNMIEQNKIVLRLSPQEALLISQALDLASLAEPGKLAPGLGRWYAKLGETILIEAEQAARNSAGLLSEVSR